MLTDPSSASPIPPDNVDMPQLFEKRDLPDGCGGYPLLLLLQPDLFERDDLPGRDIPCSVDDALCALSYLLHLLVLHIPTNTLVHGRYKV